MLRSEFELLLNQTLSPNRFRDYAPNGLQVEGKKNIHRVVTGVTASQALIEAAIEYKADAIFVHHGYFWKNEDPRIVGMKYRRLAALIKNDINLYAYHLPLDAHPVLGNNAGLADAIGLSNRLALQAGVPMEESIGIVGELSTSVSADDFAAMVQRAVGRSVLFECVDDRPVRRVALCTGGAQGYIEQAVEAGADVFITGEVSEQTIHIAREQGIHFIAAGHHATERFGARSMATFLSQECGLEAVFIDIDNPA
ncbi:Nif3-like dinuclear metal center hexameric protein [Marinomonas sp. M1K-6]|uniref:GTP cyclohydrolase 1 type 2 homolog n=1 Tax=Marinomonas profundi TaxID=2726122 RepID=A0A847R4L4_9GAMM|nr:Nif3-like dinuclear metal center hexameric protein [Marinomonas profundi]NLQ16966.1 Nif3-like dinuclear metal center hexameric protein [Marinomonas profundi]UDV02691.1 Nif3-like dinuclear metal center hexameric protein [Marinomonas profundi]